MKLNVLLVLLGFSFNVAANEIEAESKQFCEKIKSCALAEMEGEDMPPEMEAMLKPMIASMCDEMLAEVMSAEAAGEGLEKDMVACMESMNALSCDVLMSGEAETKQCKDFQDKAEK